MSWYDLDWLDTQVWDYKTALNDQVRQSYLAAHSVLEQSFRARKERYEAEMKNRKNAAEQELTSQEIMYEEFRWAEQQRALAAMSLTVLASTTKLFLDQVKGMFNKTYPPDVTGYKGRSELDRQISEYRARFAVDLETIKRFGTVREVVLARHCSVHKEGVLTDDYRKQTKQRLVGEDQRINLTPKMLDTMVLELAEFATDLSRHMKCVRDKLAAEHSSKTD